MGSRGVLYLLNGGQEHTPRVIAPRPDLGPGAVPTAAHGEYVRELQCEIAALNREIKSLREDNEGKANRIIELEHRLAMLVT